MANEEKQIESSLEALVRITDGGHGNEAISDLLDFRDFVAMKHVNHELNGRVSQKDLIRKQKEELYRKKIEKNVGPRCWDLRDEKEETTLDERYLAHIKRLNEIKSLPLFIAAEGVIIKSSVMVDEIIARARKYPNYYIHAMVENNAFKKLFFNDEQAFLLFFAQEDLEIDNIRQLPFSGQTLFEFLTREDIEVEIKQRILSSVLDFKRNHRLGENPFAFLMETTLFYEAREEKFDEAEKPKENHAKINAVMTLLLTLNNNNFIYLLEIVHFDTLKKLPATMQQGLLNHALNLPNTSFSRVLHNNLAAFLKELTQSGDNIEMINIFTQQFFTLADADFDSINEDIKLFFFHWLFAHPESIGANTDFQQRAIESLLKFDDFPGAFFQLFVAPLEGEKFIKLPEMTDADTTNNRLVQHALKCNDYKFTCLFSKKANHFFKFLKRVDTGVANAFKQRALALNKEKNFFQDMFSLHGHSNFAAEFSEFGEKLNSRDDIDRRFVSCIFSSSYTTRNLSKRLLSGKTPTIFDWVSPSVRSGRLIGCVLDLDDISFSDMFVDRLSRSMEGLYMFG